MKPEALGRGECFRILTERLNSEEAAPFRRSLLSLFQKCRVYLKALGHIPRDEVHEWAVRQLRLRLCRTLDARALPPALLRTARACVYAMCRDEVRARVIPWFAAGRSRDRHGRVAALVHVADWTNEARGFQDARAMLSGYPRVLPVVLDFEGVGMVSPEFLAAVRRRGNVECRNLPPGAEPA